MTMSVIEREIFFSIYWKLFHIFASFSALSTRNALTITMVFLIYELPKKLSIQSTSDKLKMTKSKMLYLSLM